MQSKKDETIAKIYYDPAGYGSNIATLKEAKEIDKTITLEDIKEWKAKNLERKTQLKGYNSFVASRPYQEYQMDLMFFSDLKDPDYAQGLLMINIFNILLTVIPVKTKQIPDVAVAIDHSINKMCHKPETIYSDIEGSFVSNQIQKYFKDQGIRHLTTLAHAPVAERAIKTIKNMIYKRVDASGQKWHEVLYAVLLTYNNENIHSTINMTPNEARKEHNNFHVKLNLELKAKFTRKYPNIAIGSMVKVFKKKDKLDKERVSNWSKDRFKVEAITESEGQHFYKLEDKPKVLMRSEILLV